MCGVSGILSSGSDASLAGTACIMSDALRHHDPDDAGVWVDPNEGVALGQRRLSIVDPSSAEAQPMMSPCGRYVIAFNGEIYNHLTMRADLAHVGVAPEWQGSSDTEALFAAVSHWGLQDALKRAFGMFALVLWDREKRQLHLARDRTGKNHCTSHDFLMAGPSDRN